MSQTSEPVSTIPVQEWVQGAEARWHLSKVVQRAARPDGSLLPVQITRFLDGCPDNMLDAVTRYLNASATYPSVMMDGKFFEGPFLSSGVTIARDPNNKNPTSAVMLIQVLRLNTAGLGEGDSAVDGVSCTEQSSTEYRYNASALEVLPPAEPGVTRNLGQVRRDEATGLYNYEIVTRTKQVQEFGEFVENSTAFETVTRSIRRNLSPVGFNMSAAVVTTPGTTIDVDADKNPDCSINETQRKIVAKTNVTMQIVMSENALTTEDETRTSASLTIPAASAPSGGTVTTVTAEKRKDNLHNVALRQETEKRQTVSSSSAEALHQKTTETATISASQLATADTIGEQVSNELTRFGNFRNVVRVVTALARGLFEGRRRTDRFKVTQSSTSSVVGKPSETQPGASGTGGIVRTRSIQRQDGAGDVWHIEDGYEAEKNVQNAAVQRSATAKEITEEFTDVGESASTTGEITAATPGQTRSSKLTPGGLYENTKRVVRTLLGIVFEKALSDSFMRKEDSSSATAADQVTSVTATLGTRVTSTSALQPTGAWEVRTVTETEKEVPEVQKSKAVSVKFVTKEHTDVAGSELALPTDAAIGDTVSIERTATGLFRNTLRQIRLRISGLTLGLLFSEDAFKKTSEQTLTADATPTDPGFVGGGVVVTDRGTLNEAGKWDVSRQTVTEKAVGAAQVTTSATPKALVTETLDIASSVAPPPTAQEIGRTVTSELTPGGLYRNTVRTMDSQLGRKLNEVRAADVFKDTKDDITIDASPAVGIPAANGVITVIRNTLNEAGKWDVSRQTVTEKEVADVTVSHTATLRGWVKEDVAIQAATGELGPTLESGELESVGKSEVSARTESGFYKVQTHIPTPVAREGVVRSFQRTWLTSTREAKTEYKLNSDVAALDIQDETPELTADPDDRGTVEETLFRLGDDGTAEATRTTVKYLEAVYPAEASDPLTIYEDAFSTKAMRVFKNMKELPPVAKYECVENGEHYIRTYSGVSLSDAGTYDYTEVTLTPKTDIVDLVYVGGYPGGISPPENAGAWLVGSRIYHFRNITTTRFDELNADLSHFLFYQANTAGYGFGTVVTKTRNEFGLWDGQVGFNFSRRGN